MKKEKIKYTYERGRKCEHCGAPIADHLHENRKHCTPAYYEDGSKKDCKVERNNKKASVRNKESKAIISEWKQLLERVKKLVALKGKIVTTEDLDFHEILLENALQHEHKGGQVISYFRDFEITSYIYENKHLVTIK